MLYMFIFIFKFQFQVVSGSHVSFWVSELGMPGSRPTTRVQTFVTPAWQTTIHNMLAVISITKVIIIIIIIPTKEASYAAICVKR